MEYGKSCIRWFLLHFNEKPQPVPYDNRRTKIGGRLHRPLIFKAHS
jgi:hypothetical protein